MSCNSSTEIVCLFKNSQGRYFILSVLLVFVSIERIFLKCLWFFTEMEEVWIGKLMNQSLQIEVGRNKYQQLLFFFFLLYCVLDRERHPYRRLVQEGRDVHEVCAATSVA